MVRAIAHKGFALVDILQPCVTFNKKNTYEWYGKMTYRIPPDHDAADRVRAFALSLEWEERIPIGVLYRRDDRPPFEELHPGWATRRCTRGKRRRTRCATCCGSGSSRCRNAAGSMTPTRYGRTGFRRPFRAASAALRASSSRRSSDLRRSSWTPKKPIPAMQAAIPAR